MRWVVQWVKFCKNLHFAQAPRLNTYDKEGYDVESAERIDCEPDQANVVGSKVADQPGKHYILIDLDVPHVYTPSSTPGHGHLIIGVPVDFPDYLKVLEVLSSVGVVENGFANATKSRGEGWLRVPWAKKPKKEVTYQ
jgi:hypothetical protein